ncbi:MAG: hypothetical protein QOE36_3263, partial [Gaiellaceae bacterium]|nr:hypothetical protein [Gaiellaceae bacterium]
QANAEEKPPPPWLPANPTWSRNDGTWTWGLAPAERAAAWALMFLGDVEKPVSTDALHEARVCASQLIATVRSAKIALQDAFEQAADQPADAGLLSWLEEHLPFVSKSPSPVKRDPDERARIAYGAIAQQLKDIQTAFVKLDEEIERIGEPELFRVQSLLDYEVVRNAISIQDEQLGSPFDFIFASAGVGNALGHRADTPAKKLAGMKLNHFGGFLKRSWRANDWLWGRLDGVEHVLRAVVDADRLKDISGSGTALAAIAFGCEEDSPASAEEKRLLAKLWAENAEKLRLKEYAGGDPEDQFAKAAEGAYEKKDIDHDRADRCLQLCRRALAARIQLRVLEEDLPRVAETAADDLRSGASQIANGAFWAGRFYKRDRNLFPRDLQKPGVEKSVDLFRELDVGGEKLKDETSTRLAIDVGSQLVAVAAAMAAGDRGGFPAAARGMLATARGLTLASSKVLRLVARIPAVGAALFALLVGLVIWASLSTNTLIGTFVPALALLAVASGVALLTLATSLFERSLTTWPKVLGYVVFAGVPSVFAICTGWPRLKERLASGLDDVGLSLPGFLLKLPTTLETHVGHVPTRVAFWAASAAAAVALLRLAGGPLDWLVARLRKRSRSFGWRRMMITAYRFAIFTALTALAVGFMLERTLHHKKADGTPTTWLDIADERKGTLAVLLIVSVLLFASLVEELVSESPLSRLLQPLSRLLRKIAHR